MNISETCIMFRNLFFCIDVPYMEFQKCNTQILKILIFTHFKYYIKCYICYICSHPEQNKYFEIPEKNIFEIPEQNIFEYSRKNIFEIPEKNIFEYSRKKYF